MQNQQRAMASIQSFGHGFFLIFIYLGCFAFFSNTQHGQKQSKKAKITPLSPSSSLNSNSSKALKSLPFSVLSYIHNIFSPKRTTTTTPQPTPDTSPRLISTSSSQTFSNRTEIYPCILCGEVLFKPQQLEIHSTTKHSLSELHGGDSSRNIIHIIFHSSWKGVDASMGKPPTIHKILKVHSSQKTVDRFEEYRDHVRFKASGNGGDERCLADGNERLRFYGTTMLCAAEGYTHVGACGSPYCSTCAVVRGGFAGKQAELDGVGTYETSRGAHDSLPEELEREFGYLNARRAVLVCRVVVGIVARAGHRKEDAFDSLAAENGGLLVFNPRAVLPCFVIVYSTV